MRFGPYNRNIEQVIEMAMSHQNRVHSRRKMSHSLCDALSIRLKSLIKRDTQKIHARKIGINEQGVTMEFELVTVCAEVRHAHSVLRHCAGIVCDQLSIRIQPRA